jgi:ribosomal protein S18 acetylase RimI-like enzyme
MTSPLFLAAARRLVSQKGGNIEQAAKRLVAASGSHGIDLSQVWGTVEYPGGGTRAVVRQACLSVTGAGRTAMLFVSDPPPEGDPGGPGAALAERSACIAAACGYFSGQADRPVRIAQALPDQQEGWVWEAFLAAGFVKVGNLTYMRRAGVSSAGGVSRPVAWPDGVEVVSFERLAKADERAAQAEVGMALDRSYEGTLDCPEMCGMRETPDVVLSHRSTGRFDPRLWWIVRLQGVAEGCLLLNPCPELRSVELVYIGLSPRLRGRGLSKRLLLWGLSLAAGGGRANWDVTCAVDERNAPAMSLYRGLGFKAGARRVALVKVL